jgi:hypothetical protein
MEQELSNSLTDLMGTNISVTDMNEAEKTVGEYINHLIVHDFEKLVRILYRVDVDENRLRTILKQEHTDAGILIARMIIERQIQKINFRRSHQKNDNSEW